MDVTYYEKTGQRRSHFSSTVVYSTPLVHTPMHASRNYIGNGKAKGYEGWLASRPKEEISYAPKQAFTEAGCNEKIYTTEAMHKLLNMRQAAKQKENSMRASNSAHIDNEYSNNIYSAEAGRGYPVIRHGARQKEDMYLLSPVIDDVDEYRHKMYSGEVGRGYTVVTQATRRKEAIFALNPFVRDDHEYGRMVFSQPSVIEPANTRKAVARGPWGGNSGDQFDDGVYTGIREIELTRAGGIVSIRVCYDMGGKAIRGNKNGGNHGINTDKIVIDYPSEYLTHITGYYASTMLRGPTIVKSLTFHTNRRKYGPFGDEQGIPFSSAGSVEAKIVGLSGKIKGGYVANIGVHVMEAKSPQPAYDVLSMRTCEVEMAREPDRWYAERVCMKMVSN